MNDGDVLFRLTLTAITVAAVFVFVDRGTECLKAWVCDLFGVRDKLEPRPGTAWLTGLSALWLVTVLVFICYRGAT